MKKAIWVLASPDNGHWDENEAYEAVSRCAERADVTAAFTGRTRDAGFGQEKELEVSGSEQDIEYFESCLQDELY